jgi:hypothetical protein
LEISSEEKMESGLVERKVSLRDFEMVFQKEIYLVDERENFVALHLVQ